MGLGLGCLSAIARFTLTGLGCARIGRGRLVTATGAGAITAAYQVFLIPCFKVSFIPTRSFKFKSSSSN